MNAPLALVTGATGFLGSRLVARLLADGRGVRVLARRPLPELAGRGVEVMQGELGDAAVVEAACAGVGTIFHVAAKVGVWGPYEDFFRVNVLGTRAVLAGCRRHGVLRLVYTSTPSVVYHGGDLAGVDESLPLTTRCPAAYPLTKALAEREVLAANGADLHTVALRPHLIWGVGDPHLVPRIVARARAGRLAIVGTGRNRVDMVHIENAVDAHLLAEAALGGSSSPAPKSLPGFPAGASTASNVLYYKPPEAPAAPPGRCQLLVDKPAGSGPAGEPAAGRAYFITNGEPVVLWDWINDLLRALDIPPVTRRVPLAAATAVGAACEVLWRVLPLPGEPPMTRFVAAELAKDHWFDIAAARRDLGFNPRISMAQGTAELVAHLRAEAGGR